MANTRTLTDQELGWVADLLEASNRELSAAGRLPSDGWYYSGPLLGPSTAPDICPAGDTDRDADGFCNQCGWSRGY